jgi:hypothetical protein
MDEFSDGKAIFLKPDAKKVQFLTTSAWLRGYAETLDEDRYRSLIHKMNQAADLLCEVWDKYEAKLEAEKREWVGLTEQDVHDAFQFTELIKQLSFYRERPEWCENFAAYIEAKLKEKNT